MKINTLPSADGNLYQIVYVVPDWELICNAEQIDTLGEPFLDIDKTMSKYHCDRVFRHNNFLLFTKLIEEATLVEDNLEPQETNVTLPETQ